MEVQYDTVAYVAWRRGSKGNYDQTPNFTVTAENQEVDFEHEISRETVFFTNDDENYQKKDCDFYIYGKNSFTK